MHEFRHTSFDTRGFVLSLLFIGAIVSLVAGAKYSVVFASDKFNQESRTAAAAAAVADTQLTELLEKHDAIEAERNVPSRFAVSEASVPRVSAHSYIVADMDSDVIFAQKNGTTIFPIASITKLLTALVAKEELATTSAITINEADRIATLGTPGSIQRDETLTLADSFIPLLTESNNSIAYSLARAGGSENFMRAMREKAKEIGMTLTTLEDPSGISQKNAASALDIYLLTRYLYVNAPDFLHLTRAKDARVTAESGRTYSFSNYNTVAESGHYLGGKIGYTDAARQTMTTVFEVPMGNATATVGIVVLGSENRKSDVEKLLTWFKWNATMASTTTQN